MRFPGISCCGVAFIVAGTVSLAVVFSFPVEGRLAGEPLQVSRRLQGMNGESSPEASVVKVCPVKSPPEGPASRIDLTPTKGVPVEFRCGDSLSLRPDATTSPGKVYQYNVSQNICTNTDEVTLASDFVGAELTLKGAEGGSAAAPNQVYVFTYTVEPQVDKHLCYTCNTTVGAAAGKKTDSPASGPTPQQTVACTVYIKVPKKEEEKTTTASSTTAPATTSGSHAMTLATVTVGGLLAVVLQL